MKSVYGVDYVFFMYCTWKERNTCLRLIGVSLEVALQTQGAARTDQHLELARR